MEHTFAALAAELRSIDGLLVRENVLLAPYTTFRIGGSARLGLFPERVEAAEKALAVVAEAGLPFAVIGRGSNLLVADAGFAGVVLFTERLCRFAFDGSFVTAEAGVPLTALAVQAQRRGLAGLSFAYGIPGSVGGAVRMNAGAYGGEMAEIVQASRFYDIPARSVGELDATAHCFGYRSSAYAGASGEGKGKGKILLSVTLTLHEGDGEHILGEMQEFMRRRRDKQPLELPSAGSIFKRPPGYFSGKLIEDCGLKGAAVGGAQVSEKHAGFIVNRGGATADDVLRLIAQIQQVVYARFGVALECELCRLG